MTSLYRPAPHASPTEWGIHAAQGLVGALRTCSYTRFPPLELDPNVVGRLQRKKPLHGLGNTHIPRGHRECLQRVAFLPLFSTSRYWCRIYPCLEGWDLSPLGRARTISVSCPKASHRQLCVYCIQRKTYKLSTLLNPKPFTVDLYNMTHPRASHMPTSWLGPNRRGMTPCSM
jgi:hypothetical protein